MGRLCETQVGFTEGSLCPTLKPGTVFGGLSGSQGGSVPQVGSSAWLGGTRSRLHVYSAGLEKGKESTEGCDALSEGGRVVPGFRAEVFTVVVQYLAS